jgi:hypothetical protein
MFCDACGKEMQAGQSFCSACGKPTPTSAIPPVQQPVGKVARHLPALAIIWLVYSAFTLIGAGVLFVLGMTLFGPWTHFQDRPDVPVGFLHVLFMFLGTVILIKAVASIAVGVGFLQRQPWARSLGLVLAFISLLNVPFGTAIGIYTIWVLMSPNAAEEYQRLSPAA